MIYLLYILLFFSPQSNAEKLHKHYVAITEMEWNSDKKQVEASMQLTGHDLEYALHQINGTEVSLPKVTTDLTDSVIIFTQSYFKKRFKITVKNKEYSPKIIGLEMQNDGNAIVYLTFDNIKGKPKEVEIFNSVLMDFFPAQQNITHFKFDKSKKTRTFTSANKKQTIQFQ